MAAGKGREAGALAEMASATLATEEARHGAPREDAYADSDAGTPRSENGHDAPDSPETLVRCLGCATVEEFALTRRT